MRLQKNISFKKTDEDIYKYLNNKTKVPDISAYIVRLVRNDLENKNKTSNEVSQDQLTQIIQGIEEIKDLLRTNNYTVNVTKPLQVDEAVMDSIKNLLGDDFDNF